MAMKEVGDVYQHSFHLTPHWIAVADRGAASWVMKDMAFAMSLFVNVTND